MSDLRREQEQLAAGALLIVGLALAVIAGVLWLQAWLG